MRKIKGFFALILIFFFLFLPFRPDDLVGFWQALAAAEYISGTTVWAEDHIVNNYLIIPTGATLVIKKGIKVSFKNNAKIYVDGGELIVSGTVKDPVKIKAEDESGKRYSIIATRRGKITLRNADISDGGISVVPIGYGQTFSKVLAAEYFGAVHLDNGSLDAQACNFHNNENAISFKNSNALNIRVNRSKFVDNFNYNVVSSFSTGMLPDFRFNWWGETEGPRKKCPNCSVYEGIAGQINFSNWLTSENFRDPIILIPGIMGSWEVNGEWRLDPILHSYENIYNKFIKEGYTPNEDLFEFPYQWRNSNIENAILLKDAINFIKEKRKWPKVDIVAHSMGGLLAREYIESDYYEGDVDQLITLGTPHLGAPKTYLGWEAGELGKNFESYILEKILTREAKKAGYESLFHYIRNYPIKSVEELLPQYNYIFDLDLGAPREYPTGYPRNAFLENLNDSAKLKNLLKVENDIIYGKVNKENTISAFEVIHASAFGEYWEHGYPKNYYIL